MNIYREGGRGGIITLVLFAATLNTFKHEKTMDVLCVREREKTEEEDIISSISCSHFSTACCLSGENRETGGTGGGEDPEEHGS